MSPLSPFRCPECGSQDLQPAAADGLRCAFCGTVSYPRRTPEPPPAPAPVQVVLPHGAVRQAALGLGAIIVVVIAGVVLFFATSGERTTRRATRTRLSARVAPVLPEEKGRPMAESTAVEALPKPSAEVVQLTPRPDSIGNIYFVGIYRNTGKTTIERPRAEVTLLDAAGKSLAVATGYASRDRLLPGEETPISVLASRAPRYHEVRVRVDPEAPTYPRVRPRMSISGAKIAPGRFNSYHLTGRITNEHTKAARFVQLIVLVLDPQKRIMGTTSHYLGQKLLGPGEDAPFDLDLHGVDRAPGSFRLDYDASEAD